MAGDGYRLGVDFGPSSTVAVLDGPDGRVRPLLFDASPLLPSGVFAGPETFTGPEPRTGPRLLTGADAQRAGEREPTRLEPHPKRRIDDGTVWLGAQAVPVVDLVAAVLRRVAAEARRVAGAPLTEVVLTHPATWGQRQLRLLADAAWRAELGEVRFVPEPVAAAAYFAHSPVADQPELVVATGSLSVKPPPATASPGAEPSPGPPRTGGPGGAGGGSSRPVLAACRRPVGAAASDVLESGGGGPPLRLPRLPRIRPRWWAAAATVLVVALAAVVWVNLPSDDDPITGATFLATLDDGDVVRSIAFSPDSTTLLTGGDTRLPGLWDIGEHRRIRTFTTRFGLPVSGVAFSPDGRTAAFVGGPLELWDVTTATQRAGPGSGQAVGVTAVAFSRTRIATSDIGGNVYLWDSATTTVTGAPLEVYDNGDVFDVAFSPDGSQVATAGGDGIIQFHDVVTRDGIGADLTGHDGPVLGVAWSADGETMASAGADGTIRLWDIGKRDRIGAPLTGHRGSIYEVAFSPDGRTLATAGQDGTARLWDVAGRKQLGTLRGHRGPVYDVAFSPDGTLLATGSGDRTTRLWELERG